MNTRDLQAFVAVVDSGSMVAAAAKLHLTQPGLTRRVQNLETLLGMPLLERQSKPLKPTAAGRDVYALARNVLGAVDALMAAGAPDSEPSGELRIGVPPFLSELALERPIDRLRDAFPRLTLRVTAGWSPALVQGIERGTLDVAAVMVPASAALPDTLTATPLGTQPTVLVAARDFPLPAGPLSLDVLSGFPWVLSQDGCGMRSALSRALGAAGLPFDVAVEAFGSELQLSLVARGAGIGIASPNALARSKHRDALRVVETAGLETRINVWIVHGALPGRLTRPVALLRDTLGEVLDRENGKGSDSN
ncbi:MULTISPECIES: LysR family transcriptional regulator [unclassified Burkholderia]|uniref:LysR family transcriptional regulator n=1 Tax=unclassified Burkholderia TaxID=2613784 RepID=UPI0005CF8432|nr:MULTISPECIES: LysR family transcriptional regulator [unclassified Burkholderia]RQR43889.1 LysR family transcriptional regulator [Burkholderia sp. Bp9131]RQR75728.1 LysR family transcriptional regulator [Burkholderia sp. Bp9015]RQR97305.1 LysR family transcriptional regulator [Burkholderia sp. Bp8994]RQS32361.1 LysR family transcriptional regulator [Burkholderia sp. Bp8995]RQS33161.1 LysR family transcriptional regulator [Burkholderia sp. Bp8990]